MVRQFYVDQVTDLSRQELRSVLEAAEAPVCLIGGWAVHLHVNQRFEQEHGRSYIGSRDIDLGVHVDPEWTAEQVSDAPVGDTLSRIQELGYTESRFGFVQRFLRATGDRLSEDEAGDHAMHEVFPVYVDIVPDTEQLDQFEQVFGFRPPAEPLLNPVFEQGRSEPLDDYVSWPVEEARIVPPELLAAMKVRSLPDRDEGHKRVKDAADLHAVLWYTKEYSQIASETIQYVSDSDLERLEDAFTADLAGNAATLLQVDSATVEESITRLFRR